MFKTLLFNFLNNKILKNSIKLFTLACINNHTCANRRNKSQPSLQVEDSAQSSDPVERRQAQAGPVLRHRHQGGAATVAAGRQPAQVGGRDGSAAGWQCGGSVAGGVLVRWEVRVRSQLG